MTPADLRPAPLTVEFCANASAAFTWTLYANPIMAGVYLSRMTAAQRRDVVLAADMIRAQASEES